MFYLSHVLLVTCSTCHMFYLSHVLLVTCSTDYKHTDIKACYCYFSLDLAIFNKGVYLKLKSIFHMALNLV